MIKLPSIDEVSFKKQNRADMCSRCPKRIPCGTFESICDLVVPCAVCEIRTICTSICSQMKAYLSRGNKGTIGREITYNIGDIDDFFSYKNFEHIQEGTIEQKVKVTANDIPWQAISARDRTLVEDYFKRSKTLFKLSKEHNLTVGRVSQLLFGSKGSSRDKKKKMTPTWGAIRVLKSYIKYRNLYNRFGQKLYPSQRKVIYLYYFKFKSVKEISNDFNTIPVTIYKRLTIARKKLNKFS
jgi:hypothetical protein